MEAVVFNYLGSLLQHTVLKMKHWLTLKCWLTSLLRLFHPYWYMMTESIALCKTRTIVLRRPPCNFIGPNKSFVLRRTQRVLLTSPTDQTKELFEIPWNNKIIHEGPSISLFSSCNFIRLLHLARPLCSLCGERWLKSLADYYSDYFCPFLILLADNVIVYISEAMRCRSWRDHQIWRNRWMNQVFRHCWSI